ncbi:MAG TPA: RNA polymerase subunit sigma-24 [Chloroflexi bacterium]|jgi:RNA polymerase sigma-70 factor (ECF subfamily)|nr:RNA polymerase subunit sigma-24 [Chloroflexota bacterium]
MEELTELEDLELISRSKHGDHSAYRELVERYKDAGYRVALQVLRHPTDAEDVLQESFIKAYVYLDSYSSKYRFYTWFSTIVRNVALSHLKARDWIVSPLPDEAVRPLRAAVEESPELVALASSRADIVREAVRVLPERYRRVLVLRYWHDLSYEEIASVTQQSLGAVKTQIHRGKALLGEGLHGVELGLAAD